MLKLSIKLSPIPELKAANLSKQHLEPVWRSAANGVATAVKTHFLSLPGDRFWGEASEKVRVVPLSRNRWQIGVYQRAARYCAGRPLSFRSGTARAAVAARPRYARAAASAPKSLKKWFDKQYSQVV